MKLLSILTLVFFALGIAAQALLAQTSVYGSINATTYGYSSSAAQEFNYDPNSTATSFYSDTFGLEAGVTWLFPSQIRFKVGADLREIYSFGFKGGNAGFASFRVAFVPHKKPLSPYVQLGGGYIHVPLPGGEYVVSNSSGTILQIIHQSAVTGGAAAFAFGLDIHTDSPWTICAIELGGYAGSHVALSSVGAGIVYHFSR